jgi:hypothetical protein
MRLELLTGPRRVSLIEIVPCSERKAEDAGGNEERHFCVP